MALGTPRIVTVVVTVRLESKVMIGVAISIIPPLSIAELRSPNEVTETNIVGARVGRGVGAELGEEVTVGTCVGTGVGATGKQSCHPVSVIVESEYHDMLVLGNTETPSGPVVPSYSTPSIVRWSKPDSVEKLVTDNTPEARGVMVHDSPVL